MIDIFDKNRYTFDNELNVILKTNTATIYAYNVNLQF